MFNRWILSGLRRYIHSSMLQISHLNVVLIISNVNDMSNFSMFLYYKDDYNT